MIWSRQACHVTLQGSTLDSWVDWRYIRHSQVKDNLLQQNWKSYTATDYLQQLSTRFILLVKTKNTTTDFIADLTPRPVPYIKTISMYPTSAHFITLSVVIVVAYRSHFLQEDKHINQSIFQHLRKKTVYLFSFSQGCNTVHFGTPCV